MSLRSRILVLLTSVVVAFVGLDLLVARFLVRSRFDAVEREIADERLAGALSGLRAERAAMESIAGSLAAMVAAAPAGTEPSGPASLADCELELAMLCDQDGAVLWRCLESPEEHAPLELVDFPRERLSPVHPLLVDETGRPLAHDARSSGLFTTERGTLMVGSAPFRRADGSMGRVFAGRFLTAARLAAIEEQSQVTLTLHHVDDLAGVGLDQDQRDELLTTQAIEVVEVDRIHSYRTLEDVRGFPVLVARVSSLRDVTAIGILSANDTLVSTTGVAVLLLLAMLKLLQTLVVGPLTKLTRHAIELGETDGPTTRLNSTRGDEIGTLSRELDRMVDDLERVRHANVEIAHRAGAADAAASVLHNIGNSLNGLTVSTGLLSSTLASMPADDLEPLVDALERNREDLGRYLAEDERGKHLLPFLRTVADRVREDKRVALGELMNLLGTVAYVEEQVEAQRHRADATTLFEWSALDELVRRTLEGCRTLDDRAADVLAHLELDELPRYRVDRHRFGSVLTCLILNAVDALHGTDPDRAQVVLRLHEDPSGAAVVEVEDTGQGIAPEHLEQVFRSGFTTRGAGRGFGLHEAANDAAEMGCTLTAHSPGRGRGATFRLVVPASRRAVLADAA